MGKSLSFKRGNNVFCLVDEYSDNSRSLRLSLPKKTATWHTYINFLSFHTHQRPSPPCTPRTCPAWPRGCRQLSSRRPWRTSRPRGSRPGRRAPARRDCARIGTACPCATPASRSASRANFVSGLGPYRPDIFQARDGRENILALVFVLSHRDKALYGRGKRSVCIAASVANHTASFKSSGSVFAALYSRWKTGCLTGMSDLFWKRFDWCLRI